MVGRYPLHKLSITSGVTPLQESFPKIDEADQRDFSLQTSLSPNFQRTNLSSGRTYAAVSIVSVFAFEPTPEQFY